MLIHSTTCRKAAKSLYQTNLTVYDNPCSGFLAYVVVNFLFQLIFIFPLFWGMVMYANEFKTKEKQKLTEIKN